MLNNRNINYSFRSGHLLRNDFCILFFFLYSQETINSASSITQSFSSELLDGNRKLLALVTSGNVKAHNTSALQPINGPMGGPQEVDADNFSFSITLLIRICLFHFILAMCLLLFMYLV